MVISLYVRNIFFEEVIPVYKEMLSKNVQTTDFTYPSVLKACGELLDCDTMVEVHKSILDSSIKWSLFMHNALVFTYGRFGKLDVARHLFDNMSVRDDVSWNTIISCYASRGIWKEAFRPFGCMQEEGIEMNVIIWNTISGALFASSEKKTFAGAVLEWMPSGPKVAAVYDRKAENECPSIVYFERNGLERIKFSVGEGVNAKVKFLKWNCSSDLLAGVVECENYDAIKIWYFSNNHWYVKHEIRYLKQDEVRFIWNQEKPFAVDLLDSWWSFSFQFEEF
ncbi:elongator complex protein 1 [Lathyrus oleraceus]|uniref:elongator complex protein 1 n=1 Tax=Pisum sativum TaxID=3888 RepID=UPI0021D3248E|nr:elongator complex protein 1-like [Pisum sativum]